LVDFLDPRVPLVMNEKAVPETGLLAHLKVLFPGLEQKSHMRDCVGDPDEHITFVSWYTGGRRAASALRVILTARTGMRIGKVEGLSYNASGISCR
jgi:hypothetical protein